MEYYYNGRTVQWNLYALAIKLEPIDIIEQWLCVLKGYSMYGVLPHGASLN